MTNDVVLLSVWRRMTDGWQLTSEDYKRREEKQTQEQEMNNDDRHMRRQKTISQSWNIFNKHFDEWIHEWVKERNTQQSDRPRGAYAAQKLCLCSRVTVHYSVTVSWLRLVSGGVYLMNGTPLRDCFSVGLTVNTSPSLHLHSSTRSKTHTHVVHTLTHIHTCSYCGHTHKYTHVASNNCIGSILSLLPYSRMEMFFLNDTKKNTEGHIRP